MEHGPAREGTLPAMNARHIRFALLAVSLLAGCAARSVAPVDDGPRQVRTAWLTAEVERPGDTAVQVAALAAELRGRVVRSESSGDTRVMLTLRVPSASLDAALARLEALALRVTSKQVNAEDVTAEHVDLEAQRKNLTAARDRLLALLERARTATEALEVSRALEDVQGRLEQLEGRLALLVHDVAMAQVVVTLTPRETADFSAWQPLEVARSAAVALGVLLQVLANAAIALAVFAPLWGPLLFVIRRRRAARRPV